MARNNKTGAKKIAKRLRELETYLRNDPWPSGNPKAATARFQVVRELAQMRGMRVQDLIKQLKTGTYSPSSDSSSG
jgi:hypothetical protein